jgi:hypothetical protein
VAQYLFTEDTEMTKQILTASLLLLSLFTYTEAQNRSAKENLEGLREIGVVVKYANADGLDAAMQPTVLQMLQDRAKDGLKQADIPVLQSTEQSEMSGRPRLVFTVTANKPSDHVPTVVVESSLYERVRLGRDRTKEMELGTWVKSAFGYASRVTTEMIFQVFDAQLNGFIKDYREANPQPTLAKTSTTSSDQYAVPLKANGNSLQGLNGIDLYVWSGPSRSPAAPLASLIKVVQSEAEKKLKDAGIPLLKFMKQPDGDGSPLLYVSFTLNHPTSHAPAIEVQGKLWQQVRPLRDPKKDIRAVTWELQSGNDGPVSDEAVLQVVSAQIDEFIKAYRAANPQPSSASTVKAQ